MDKRWIGSLVGCILMLALCAHPSVARLSEGSFVPFSQGESNFADSQVKFYRIQKGDTLCQISQRYNVSLKTLMLINEMDENTILEVGDNLSIPGGVNRMVAQAMPEPSRSLSLPKPMIWPIVGTISCPFGWRKSGFHHGVDIANKIGTPIKAVAAGTVSFTGYKSIYGLTVIIDHPDGKQTLYAHTQKTYVHKGEKVSQGEIIAAVGMTGVTTGPHVHLEVRNGNEVSNPMSYLQR